MFEPISITLWLLLLISFVKTIGVLRFGRRLIDRKSKYYYVWLTFSSFLRQGNIPCDRKYKLILSITVSIAIFFATCYLTNSVKTDLVVVLSPITINDYDDIIARNVTVVQNSKTPEYEKLMGSPENSKERIMMRNFFDVPFNTPSGPWYDWMLEQKAIIIAPKENAEVYSYPFLDKYGSRNPESRLLLSTDSGAKSYIASSYMRKDCDKTIQKLILDV